MPDVSIVNTTVTSTPKDYTVPGTQELLLKAVTAKIDGSATASSYLPALQLLDPAGRVMWTAVDTSNPVTAGASVDASWFPGVSKHSGGGTITSGLATMRAGTNIGSNQLFTNGNTTAISFDSFIADSSGTYGVPGGTSTDWTIKASGAYQIVLAVSPTAPWANAFGSPVRFIVDLLGNFEAVAEDMFDPDGTSFNPLLTGMVTTWVGTGQVLPATMRVGLRNLSGANFTSLGSFTFLYMFRVGPELAS